MDGKAEAKLSARFGKFDINYRKDTGPLPYTAMTKTCIYPVQKHHIHALRDTLDVISGKWKLVILAALLKHKYRFRELSREIGITPRILAKELRELEVNQLVKRTVCDTRPITVEYESTPHSQTLTSVVDAMVEWGLLHHETVVGKKRVSVPAEVEG